MRLLLVSFAALALAFTPVADAKDKENPYHIDKRTFKKQYKIIALAPIDANASLQMPDSVALMIEEEITAHLRKRGYTVIPTSVLADIRARMEAQVGGFTDPESGGTDMAKVRAVREHSFRELWFQHQLDAVATIRVQISLADIKNDRAEWDGVKQSVQRDGRRLDYTASAAASSVSFAVYDHTNKPLYVAYGGIEMLMKRVGQSFEALDPNQYFTDEKLIRKAARIAVKAI